MIEPENIDLVNNRVGSSRSARPSISFSSGWVHRGVVDKR